MRILYGLTIALLLLECSLVFGLQDRLHCLKSNNQDVVKRIRLNLLKEEILLRLNLEKAPENPDPETAQNLKDLNRKDYQAISSAQKLQDDKTKPCVEVDKRISKLTAYFPKQIETSLAPGSNSALFNTLQMSFEVDFSDGRTIDKAELRLYKIVVHQNSTIQERVDIFLLTEAENYLDPYVLTFGAGANVNADRNGYVVFDLQSAIHNWKGHTPSLKGELKLKVMIRTANKEGYSFPPTIQFAADNTTTQLVITSSLPDPVETKEEFNTTGITDNRYKRDTSSEVVDCALRPLVVNFREDFGWTWILHPETLTFNFCSGLCGRVNSQTRHSRYLARLASVSSNPVASGVPCCVANGFKSEVLTLAPVLGANRTTVETFEDITITSCVCR